MMFRKNCRILKLLLGSTALTILVTQASAAPSDQDASLRAPTAKTVAKVSQARVAKPARTLPSEIVNALNYSVRGGKNSVLAGVFDAVYRNPDQRDQVIDYARGLAPGLARSLTTAADLGVLTSGQRLTLAPNAAQVMMTRSVAASGIGASAYAAPVMVPMANNPSPNLPLSASTFAQTWNLDLIGANTAYGRGFTGKDASNNPVYVAVGDTGFDVNNNALRNKLDLSRAMNYILVNPGDTYDPTDVGVQSTDAKDQHGSHVAGLIAAEKFDNVAMHGVAYDAKVVPIRVISAGKNGGAPNAEPAPGFSTVDALNYFTSLNNVMVYNASYGPSLPEGTPPQSLWSVSPYSTDEAEAAGRALKAGKIIVAAAGNDRDDHPQAGLNPSGLALYPFIRPEHLDAGVYHDYNSNLDYSSLLSEPGIIIGVMSIGIKETSPGSGVWQKQPAYYSNYCGVTASWCVAAPGGDVTTDGGVYSTVPYDNYAALQGTSMAAPTVSGAIAVLIGAYPDYNARDLARLLFSTTEDLGAAGLDAVYGYGLIRLDRATDGPTILAAGTTQTVAANTTVYWSRPLAASGGFNKDGDGILTIAGRTTAPGNVTVLGGTLAVDGTLSVIGNDHALTVDRGSTLAGIGEINGATTIAGTLSPGKMPNVTDLIANGAIAPGTPVVGNSAGMLTFNDSVTLTATATTRIDIDGTLIVPGGPGTYDRIIVTGPGNIFSANGTLTPVLRDSVGTPSNYTPVIGTRFMFVEATYGAHTAGAFTSLVQPDAGLPVNGRFDIIYAPTSITLAVTPLSFANLTAGSLDKNQQSVAGALDAARPVAGTMPNTAAKTLFDALYSLTSSSSYSTVLGQLGGSSQPAVTSAAATAFTGFMGSLADRQNALMLGTAGTQEASSQAIAFSYADNTPSAEARQAADAFASAMPVAPSNEGWGVWGQAFGRWSTVGDAGGLQGSKSRSGGFTLGADKLLADDLIGGLAMGFTRTTTDADSGNGTSNSYSGAIYASWTPGRAVIDMRAALGQTQVQTSRTTSLTAGTINGNTQGFGGSIGLEAGYLVPLAQFTMKPYAGITWQGLRLNGYSETQQPFGLTYPAQTFEKLTTTLGVAFSTTTRAADAVTLMPELKVGWAHDLRDTTLVSQAALLDSAFSINAADPGRDAALVGLKLAGWTRESLRLFVAYNGEFRSNATSHQVTGGGRVTW